MVNYVWSFPPFTGYISSSYGYQIWQLYVRPVLTTISLFVTLFVKFRHVAIVTIRLCTSSTTTQLTLLHRLPAPFLRYEAVCARTLEVVEIRRFASGASVYYVYPLIDSERHWVEPSKRIQCKGTVCIQVVFQHNSRKEKC